METVRNEDLLDNMAMLRTVAAGELFSGSASSEQVLSVSPAVRKRLGRRALAELGELYTNIVDTLASSGPELRLQALRTVLECFSRDQLHAAFLYRSKAAAQQQELSHHVSTLIAENGFRTAFALNFLVKLQRSAAVGERDEILKKLKTLASAIGGGEKTNSKPSVDAKTADWALLQQEVVGEFTACYGDNDAWAVPLSRVFQFLVEGVDPGSVPRRFETPEDVDAAEDHSLELSADDDDCEDAPPPPRLLSETNTARRALAKFVDRCPHVQWAKSSPEQYAFALPVSLVFREFHYPLLTALTFAVAENLKSSASSTTLDVCRGRIWALLALGKLHRLEVLTHAVDPKEAKSNLKRELGLRVASLESELKGRKLVQNLVARERENLELKRDLQKTEETLQSLPICLRPPIMVASSSDLVEAKAGAGQVQSDNMDISPLASLASTLQKLTVSPGVAPHEDDLRQQKQTLQEHLREQCSSTVLEERNLQNGMRALTYRDLCEEVVVFVQEVLKPRLSGTSCGQEARSAHSPMLEAEHMFMMGGQQREHVVAACADFVKGLEAR